MGTTLKIRQPTTFDLRTIMPKLRDELGLLHDESTVALLTEMMPMGWHLQFVLRPRGFTSCVRVLCPSCRKPRDQLVLLEGSLRCRVCFHLATQSRTIRRFTLHAHVIRPLQMFQLLRDKLGGSDLTARQRQVLINKIQRLRRAMPSHLIECVERGRLKVPNTEYASTLSQVL